MRPSEAARIASLLGLDERSREASRSARFCEEVRNGFLKARAHRRAQLAQARRELPRMLKAIASIEVRAERLGPEWNGPLLDVYLPPLRQHIESMQVRHLARSGRPPDADPSGAIQALARLYEARTGKRASKTREGPFSELVRTVLGLEDPARHIRRAL